MSAEDSGPRPPKRRNRLATGAGVAPTGVTASSPAPVPQPVVPDTTPETTPEPETTVPAGSGPEVVSRPEQDDAPETAESVQEPPNPVVRGEETGSAPNGRQQAAGTVPNLDGETDQKQAPATPDALADVDPALLAQVLAAIQQQAPVTDPPPPDSKPARGGPAGGTGRTRDVTALVTSNRDTGLSREMVDYWTWHLGAKAGKARAAWEKYTASAESWMETVDAAREAGIPEDLIIAAASRSQVQVPEPLTEE